MNPRELEQRIAETEANAKVSQLWEERERQVPIANITLRDFFAGCALIGIHVFDNLTYQWSMDDRAQKAYEQADAMLYARGE